MTDPVVRCEVVAGVATVTLDSPANRNALSRALVADLHVALDRTEGDDVRAIVLTHTGNTFCAGADLKERQAGRVDSSPVVAVFRRLMEGSRPTIAAVTGAVRAGGIGLMASCDLVVVRPQTDFAFTEVRIGAAPAMIAVPILRRCNPSHIATAFLTGDTFDATRALQIGLVTHVVDDVAAEAQRLGASITRGAPGAIAATKALLRSVPGEPLDTAFPRMQQLSESLFEGDEAAEGMRAFFEKRAPSWAP